MATPVSTKRQDFLGRWLINDEPGTSTDVTDFIGRDIIGTAPDATDYMGRALNFADPDAYAADTAYDVGDYVKPSTGNVDFVAVCTAATDDKKSSATTEPTWANLAVGETVVDDKVTWMCLHL